MRRVHLLRARPSSAILLAFAGLPGVLLPAAAPAQEPIPLDTVPVLGSRVSVELPLRTRSVEVWTRDRIERLPARNVADVLGWTMGVDVAARSPVQADVSMRGAGFEQVLVLVDGVRVSDPQTGHFDLDLSVPLERIERIEILRGPASAMYGSDAVGGVVNVVTRRDPTWSARAEGGSFETARGAIHGGFDLPGGASLELAGELGRSDGHREGTDWDERVGRLSLRAPVAGGVAVGHLGGMRRAFGADGFYADAPSFETTRTRTASLGWRSNAAARFQLEPRLSWRRHDDDFVLRRDDPAFYRNLHTTSRLAGELVARLWVGPAFALSGGIEGERSELESETLGDRSEDAAAVFAEAVVRLPRAIDLTLGLRQDEHEVRGGFTSPSAAVAIEPRDGVRLRGSAGRSFRGPSWTERHYVDPEHEARADLRPERSTSVEVGADLAPSGTVELGATAFRRTSRDLIDWARPTDGEAPVWETRNVNRAVFRGIEVEATWRPDARTEVGVGSAHLSVDADAEPGFESKYALRPLADELHLRIGRELAGRVEGAMKMTRARRAGDPAHLLADLRVAVRFDRGILHLDARNLTGSEHLDPTGNPVAGRALFLGLRIGG